MKIKTAFIIFLSILIFSTGGIVFAQNYVPLAPIGEYIPSEGVDIGTYAQNAVKILIAIAGVLAVIMIMIGGVQYMSTDAISGKNDGKEKITGAIFGFLLAVAAWLILSTINPALLGTDLKIDPVNPREPKALAIKDLASNDAWVGQIYSANVVATGGTPPITKTLSAGSLPPEFEPFDGNLITGRSYEPGNYNFTITAVDSGDPQQNVSEEFTITIKDLPPLSFVRPRDSEPMPQGTVGQPYTGVIQVTGGLPPYSISIIGSLPQGLFLRGRAGGDYRTDNVISGRPSSRGRTAFSVRVVDSRNQDKRNITFIIIVQQ